MSPWFFEIKNDFNSYSCDGWSSDKLSFAIILISHSLNFFLSKRFVCRSSLGAIEAQTCENRTSFKVSILNHLNIHYCLITHLGGSGKITQVDKKKNVLKDFVFKQRYSLSRMQSRRASSISVSVDWLRVHQLALSPILTSSSACRAWTFPTLTLDPLISNPCWWFLHSTFYLYKIKGEAFSFLIFSFFAFSL